MHVRACVWMCVCVCVCVCVCLCVCVCTTHTHTHTHTAARETIKRVVDKKTHDMINLWADDINWVKKSLDKNRKHPPLHMDDAGSQYHLQFAAAPFAGAAAWAKNLLQRIQTPHELMLTSHHVVSTKEYQDVFEQFKNVENALTDYIERQYQDWQELMETVFRGGEDIMGINIVRRNAQTQLLEVTFPREVAVLFKEVEGWERVGYSIPFVAMEHSKDKERISVVRCHVRAMAREYNTILSALAPWERKIFADKLKALDRKIGPAVTRITWSNKGIVEFCRDVRKLCTGSQGLVDDFKSYTTNVARCCREMAHLPLVVIEHKKLYTAPEFVAVQAKHREHVVETLQADVPKRLLCSESRGAAIACRRLSVSRTDIRGTLAASVAGHEAEPQEHLQALPGRRKREQPRVGPLYPACRRQCGEGAGRWREKVADDAVQGHQRRQEE